MNMIILNIGLIVVGVLSYASFGYTGKICFLVGGGGIVNVIQVVIIISQQLKGA